MRRIALGTALLLAPACGEEEEAEIRNGVVAALSTTQDGSLQRASELSFRDESGETRAFSVGQLLNVELTAYRSSGLALNRSLAAAPSAPPVGQRAELLEDDAINTGLDNPGRSSGLAFRFVTAEGIPSSISNREGPDLFIFELGLTGGRRGDDSFAALPGDPLSLRGLGLDSDRSADLGSEAFARVGPEERVDVERFSNVAPEDPASPVLSLDELERVSLQSLGRSALDLYAIAVDLDDLGYAPDESVQGFEILRFDGNQSPDPCLILGIPDTVSR
ncbi:MAG: hypothetical protein AAGD10_05940 [Myxococcota bacterium]